jgi:hypothetical protein
MIGPKTMDMLYQSPRRLGVFAKGLIDACVDHFDDDIDVVSEDLSGGRGEKVRFTIVRRV